MEIMHACDIIPFQWPRKEKRKKNTSKDLLYPNTLTILLHKISTIPTYIEKCYSKYSICAISLDSKSYFFLLCNSKLMGK
jgi:hypothetical protein